MKIKGPLRRFIREVLTEAGTAGLIAGHSGRKGQHIDDYTAGPFFPDSNVLKPLEFQIAETIRKRDLIPEDPELHWESLNVNNTPDEVPSYAGEEYVNETEGMKEIPVDLQSDIKPTYAGDEFKNSTNGMENIDTGIDYNTKPDYKIYDKAFKNDTNGFKIIGESKVNAKDKLRNLIKSVMVEASTSTGGVASSTVRTKSKAKTKSARTDLTSKKSSQDTAASTYDTAKTNWTAAQTSYDSAKTAKSTALSNKATAQSNYDTADDALTKHNKTEPTSTIDSTTKYTRGIDKTTQSMPKTGMPKGSWSLSMKGEKTTYGVGTPEDYNKADKTKKKGMTISKFTNNDSVKETNPKWTTWNTTKSDLTTKKSTRSSELSTATTKYNSAASDYDTEYSNYTTAQSNYNTALSGYKNAQDNYTKAKTQLKKALDSEEAEYEKTSGGFKGGAAISRGGRGKGKSMRGKRSTTASGRFGGVTKASLSGMDPVKDTGKDKNKDDEKNEGIKLKIKTKRLKEIIKEEVRRLFEYSTTQGGADQISSINQAAAAVDSAQQDTTKTQTKMDTYKSAMDKAYAAYKMALIGEPKHNTKTGQASSVYTITNPKTGAVSYSPTPTPGYVSNITWANWNSNLSNKQKDYDQAQKDYEQAEKDYRNAYERQQNAELDYETTTQDNWETPDAGATSQGGESQKGKGDRDKEHIQKVGLSKGALSGMKK